MGYYNPEHQYSLPHTIPPHTIPSHTISPSHHPLSHHPPSPHKPHVLHKESIDVDCVAGEECVSVRAGGQTRKEACPINDMYHIPHIPFLTHNRQTIGS